VLHRVFIGEGDVKRYSLQKDLWELSETLIPPGQVYDFNQALMDFGATVCTARKPVCLVCPMQDFCKAFPCTPKAHCTRKHNSWTFNTALVILKSLKSQHLSPFCDV
jgi:adenine-specific DNA glycosylase